MRDTEHSQNQQSQRQSQQQTQQLINKALALFNQGQAKQAFVVVQQGLQSSPNHVELNHLAGFILTRVGQYQVAVDYFRQALAHAPQHHELLNNLASALNSLNLPDQALGYSQQAIALKPNHYPYLKTQAMALLANHQPEQAQAVLLGPGCATVDDVERDKLLGDCARQIDDDSPEAEQWYRQALSKKPGYVAAANNLALVYRAQGKTQAANQQLQAIIRSGVANAEVLYNQATVQFELGEITAAEDLLRQAITKAPLYAQAHESLSELLFQTGRQTAMGQSYAQVQAGNAQLPEAFWASYVKVMVNAEQFDQAQVLLNQALAAYANSRSLRLLQSELHAARGDLFAAQQVLEQLQLHRPPFASASIDLLVLYVRSFEFEKASGLVQQLLAAQPLNQFLWAVQGDIWRHKKDERYHWLNDFSRFVVPAEIQAPNGYRTLAGFMSALQACLEGLHRTTFQPIGQTLVNGTQTPGRLFRHPEPEIQQLVAQLNDVVNGYLADLPRDSKHPLLNRIGSGFRYSGSWSVRLNSGGFHVSHVHPEGWLSSAFYVAVPASVQAGAGDILFGQSPYGLGDTDVVAKAIVPKSGMLALFPSYVWHQTNPFAVSGNEHRITSPFDILPVA